MLVNVGADDKSVFPLDQRHSEFIANLIRRLRLHKTLCRGWRLPAWKGTHRTGTDVVSAFILIQTRKENRELFNDECHHFSHQSSCASADDCAGWFRCAGYPLF